MTATPEKKASKDLVGFLPPDLQAALAIKKMQREYQVQLSNMTWGKALDVSTRHAVAEYCQRYGIDPATGQPTGEVDLSEALGDARSFTSLLAIRNRLIVSGNDRVLALEPVQ